MGKKERKGNVFHLTFDDGLREIHDYIAPILKQKGIPATIFLNTEFIDNKNLFYRYKVSLIIEEFQRKGIENLYLPTLNKNIDKSNILAIKYKSRFLLTEIAQILDLDFDGFLKTQKPYLSSVQIESLIKDSFTFGAHSIDHPDYSELTLKEQIHQTKSSIEEVTTNFNLSLQAFAFPFSDRLVSDDFFKELDKEDKDILTFGTEIFRIRNNPLNLQRFPMEGNLLDVKTLIKTKLIYYFLMKKIKLK